MDLRSALDNAGASRLSFSTGDVCLVEDDEVVIPEMPDNERKFHENGRFCVVLSSPDICRKITYPIVTIAPLTHRVDLKGIADFEIRKTSTNGLQSDSLIMLGHVQPIRKTALFRKFGTLNSGEWDLMLAHLFAIIDR